MINSALMVHSSAPSALAHPSYQAQARLRTRKDGIPLTPRSHLGPFPLRPRTHSRPFPLCPISQSPVPSQPQPFPLRHDLTRRCRCRDAKHVAQGACWHCRAPRAGCGGESSVRRPCKLRASCNMACAVQRNVHLQYATCHGTRTCHTPQCASAFAMQDNSGHAS
jgi:hypothetical protein